jgi:DNA-nicking Smr family endonuclease
VVSNAGSPAHGAAARLWRKIGSVGKESEMTVPDDDLFRVAMSDVEPLPVRQRKRVSAAERPSEDTEVAAAQALARREALDAAAHGARADPNYFTLGEVPRVAPFDHLAWKKDGVQEGVYRNLRLGKYPIESTLDLHRHTVREARQALFDFLDRCQRRGRRTVLVTHGRGVHSDPPARLKSYVAHWLRQCPEVNALHTADRRHGGTGAVYVLLRKGIEERETNRERHGGKSTPHGPGG